MTKEQTAVAPSVPVVPASAPEDYSEEIIRFVEKEPQDKVSCRHVSGNNYRCNWWSPAKDPDASPRMMTGYIVPTYVVRLSRFMTVTKTAAGLTVNDWTQTPSQEAASG